MLFKDLLMETLLLLLTTSLIVLLIALTAVSIFRVKRHVVNLRVDQLQFVQQVALLFTQAAEQLWLDSTLENKKAWATAMLRAFFDYQKIDISDALIAAAIEASVYSGLTPSIEVSIPGESDDTL